MPRGRMKDACKKNERNKKKMTTQRENNNEKKIIITGKQPNTEKSQGKWSG